MRISSAVLQAVSDRSSQSAQPSLKAVSGEPGHYTMALEPVHAASTPAPARVSTPNVQHHHHQHAPISRVTSTRTSGNTPARAANVEALIGQLQRQFPNAHVRITGRGRTVRRQAELMAQRRRANRRQFLRTYRPAAHITEMDQWVTAHPQATEDQAATAFEDIINRARARGAGVSNHLSDRARDISIPAGGARVQNEIRNWLVHQGAHVINEHDATGGPHWHVDY